MVTDRQCPEAKSSSPETTKLKFQDGGGIRPLEPFFLL